MPVLIRRPGSWQVTKLSYVRCLSESLSSDWLSVLIKRKFVDRLICLFGIAWSISACGSLAVAELPVSTLAPGAVETIIFETAAAAQTQTVQALPPTQVITDTPTLTKTPTQTPSPTATFLFVLPTSTPVVLPTVSNLSSSGSGSSSTSSDSNTHDYEGSLHCDLVGKSPHDGTVFSPRKKFTVRWTVKNTGTASWRKHTIDYRYIGGDKFHDRERYDLNVVVDPGETVDIMVDMHAPKNPGSYETTWVVGLNTGGLCKMTLAIVVK